tara:strand:+ start:14174 stop:14527 length:354 start_codon:yes stop_codon:yes gene_type:complete
MSKTTAASAKTAAAKAKNSSGKPRASHSTPTKSIRTAKRRDKAPTANDAPIHSKCDQVLQLLRRNKGASLAELQEVTGWQAHSVRGFLSGTVKKRMGLSLSSVKPEHGDRRYTIGEA